MEVNGITANILAGVFTLIGTAIGHVTTLITARTEGSTELSVADKIANKEIELKELQLEHEIRISSQKYINDANFNQQNFAREVIQNTLKAGSVDEQIRNLRAYANIGLIEEPYASKILELEAEELPTASLSERILGDASYELDLPVSYFEQLIVVARAVGLVEIKEAGGGGRFGTGFMVGDGILVTADHVIPDASVAISGSVLLDYKEQANGTPATARFALEPGKLLIVDRAIGYALVAVSKRSQDGRNLADFGVISSAASLGEKVEIGDRVNLVHHPKAGPKSVAMREGRIIFIQEDRIHYTSYSTYGSAGAPVLSDQLDILAIHYARVPRTDGDGKILNKQGELRKSGSKDPDEIDWIAKEGVSWRSVLGSLQEKLLELPAAEAKLLRSIKGIVR